MIGQYRKAALDLINKAGNLSEEQKQELLHSADLLDKNIETNKELGEFISDLSVIAKHHLPHIINSQKQAQYLEMFTQYIRQETAIISLNNVLKDMPK